MCNDCLMAEQKFPYAGREDDEDIAPPPPWHQRLSSNLPALIGFVILVVIVVWGVAHLLVLAQPWFSSLIEKPRVTQVTQTAHPANTISSGTLSVAPPASNNNIHPQKPATHTQATPADLSVHVLDIGVIDPATGAFVNRAPTSPADLAAVRFDIANDGGASTGAWYFSAQLPTATAPYRYNSPEQEPLGPGDHIVNTLRFSPVVSLGGIFNVIVDPQGIVNESNETNNTATQFVPMPAYY